MKVAPFYACKVFDGQYSNHIVCGVPCGTLVHRQTSKDSAAQKTRVVLQSYDSHQENNVICKCMSSGSMSEKKKNAFV